ncbi:MAG TPA: hypothetical protein VFS05_16580, partial [Gemmatimonadaceae bacterium]|nr:hypothetical protein [Gemmatimonadaceae bacterium]
DRFRLVPAAHQFTPYVALRNLAERAASAAYTVLPIGLLIPVLLVGRIYRFHWRWRAVAAFLVLPLLHFFYWYSKIRFFSELLPFAYAGLAALLIHVARRNLRLAASLVMVTLAGSVALLTMPWRTWSEDAPWVNEGYSGWHHLLGTFDALDRARREHGRIVVFVREGRRDFEPVLDRLYALDRDGLDGDIVVARDLGAENERLLRALPGRAAYRVEWNAREQRAEVVPMAR